MDTQVSDSVQFYINEPTSWDYPEHVNKAIEANRALALSGLFHLDHQNGNHTIWVNDGLRICVTRCETPTVHIHMSS